MLQPGPQPRMPAFLPAAILQQYPALAGMNWEGTGPEDDISGRSSFDASSGGEYYEDEGDGGYVGPVGATAWSGNEWASDYEGR